MHCLKRISRKNSWYSLKIESIGRTVPIPRLYILNSQLKRSLSLSLVDSLETRNGWVPHSCSCAKRSLSSTASLTNLRHRRWLNSFLLAVSLRNLPRARLALSNFVLLPSFYARCLSLLLKQSPDIHLLKLIHDDYVVYLKKNGQLKQTLGHQDIAYQFLQCIIENFETSASSKLARVLYSHFAANVCKVHSIEPRAFLDSLDGMHKASFFEICRIARLLSGKRLLRRSQPDLNLGGPSVEATSGTTPDVVPVTVRRASIQLQSGTSVVQLYDKLSSSLPPATARPQRDAYGFVSYPELCDYVSRTRFTGYDKTHSGKPMYGIYSSMNEHDKAEFMHLYLLHNRARELSIEENCLSMVRLESDTSKNHTALVFRFRAQHQRDLFRWLEKSVESITKILLDLDVKDFERRDVKAGSTSKHSVSVRVQPRHNPNYSLKNPESLAKSLQLEAEEVVRQYHAVISIAKPATLVTLILSQMILATSFPGRINMVSLLSDIVLLFKHACRRDIGPLSQIPTLYGHDDFISLFTALIAIMLPHCTISIGASTLATAKQDMLLSPLLAGSDDPQFWGENPVAFIHRIVPGRIHKSGAIIVHPWLQAHFAADGVSTFHLLYLPMLVPPKKWHANGGGYLLDLKPFMYDKNAGSAGSETMSNAKGLQQIHQGLDLLGKIPWAINPRVFAVFDRVMREGAAFISIPPTHRSIVADRKLTRAERIEMHGLRTGYEHTHSFAAALNANGDAFYLPHQVDFRGRAYPMTLILLHHMDDSTRALMMFWEGRPLGHDGFDWIQYQLVGVFGHDKMKMAERLAFVESHWQEILSLAKNPHSPGSWWRQGEKPWQTLALCFEVAAVSAHIESGQDVASFISHCPVHQDGTCNGLQHYAALGRDSAGAAAVNLSAPPGESRGDVYVEVLDKVRDQVALDAGKGNPLATRIVRDNMLSRSLIKQTIMTTVYGVSVFGASRQIYGKMKEMGLLKDVVIGKCVKGESTPELDGAKEVAAVQEIDIVEGDGRDPPNTLAMRGNHSMFETAMTPEPTDFAVANYLACSVLTTILTLFQQAKHIERWLVSNCRRVCTSYDSTDERSFTQQHSRPFKWTLPLGFPIVQLYRSKRTRNVATALQSIKFAAPLTLAPINIRKQCNGVAPNFVHSIDATHMYLTAAAAHAENIAFAAVHDLYWTFASDVPRLGRLLRQQFVRLYQQDITGEMQSELETLVSRSLQLVYFKATESPGLADALTTLRGTNRKLVFLQNELRELKKCLNEANPNHGGNHAVMRLVDQYHPQLYVQTSATLQTLEPYDQDWNGDRNSLQKLTKGFVPVFVPVRLVKPPATGDFDIEQVLLSPYFFS